MGRNNSFEELMDRGKQSLDSGDLQTALESFLQARNQQGDDQEVLYCLGIVCARLGAYDRAVEALTSLIDSDADYLHKLHVGMILGYVYTLLEQYDKALPFFKNIVEAGFENAQAYAAIGYLLDRMGDFKGAVMNLYRAIELDPENANAHNSLGYIYAESNLNLDEALKECSRAVELDGDNPSYLDSLGWVYYKMGKLAQARSHLRKASRLAPDNPEIVSHLREVLRKMGRDE
jgi:tetratricopeptide (TPR) repeat protein